jgi:hypothetical protein
MTDCTTSQQQIARLRAVPNPPNDAWAARKADEWRAERSRLESKACPNCGSVPGEPCATKQGRYLDHGVHHGRAALGRSA